MRFFLSNMDYYKAKLRGVKKSLTVWFNAIAAAALSGLPFAVDAFPQIKGYIPDNIYSAAWVVLVIGNILLRVKTTKDLADK